MLRRNNPGRAGFQLAAVKHLRQRDKTQCCIAGCDKLKGFPEKIAALPLVNKSDLRFRFEMLLCELNTASKRLDDDKCIFLKEALIIFGTALYRLQSLGSLQTPGVNISNPAGKKAPLSGEIIGMHAP